MSRKVLIVGGVVVGGYLLYKLLTSPSSPVASTRRTIPTNQTATAVVAGLVQGAITGIANLGTPAGGSSLGGAASPVSSPAITSAPTLPDNFDTSNYSVSDNFMYTDSSGNFIAG